jgi:hypothetical protein
MPEYQLYMQRSDNITFFRKNVNIQRNFVWPQNVVNFTDQDFCKQCRLLECDAVWLL